MMSTEFEGNTEWMRIPVQLTLPCFLPVGASQHGAAWQITGEKESLLKSAVRAGVQLNMEQLLQLHHELKFALPAKGEGKGKRGNPIKADYAASLIKYLFPGISDEERERMWNELMGSTAGVKKQSVRCPEDVINAVKGLGEEAERDFKFVHEVALNQQAVEQEMKKNKRLPAQGPDAYTQRTYTPGELKTLLPRDSGAWCNRQPVLKRYQGGYPGGGLKFKTMQMLIQALPESKPR